MIILIILFAEMGILKIARPRNTCQETSDVMKQLRGMLIISRWKGVVHQAEKSVWEKTISHSIQCINLLILFWHQWSSAFQELF